MEFIEKSENLLREYTISSDEDLVNIQNGRCPNYALTWGTENAAHWPTGHNYFIGNNDINCDNKELREILGAKLKAGTLKNHIVFCDLDGVLADFEQGVKKRFKKNIDEIQPQLMWGVINKSKSFFETLPFMPRGKELWENIKHHDPIILTGVPPGSATGAEQKRKWCAANLGQDVHVIACATRDKPKYCLQGSILIDDRTDNLTAWNEKGGKFILYNETNTDEIVERINRYINSNLSHLL